LDLIFYSSILFKERALLKAFELSQIFPTTPRFLGLVFCGIFALSCATTQTQRTEKNKTLPPPPPITQETTMEDLIAIGIDYGGETLARVKSQIQKRQATKEALKELRPLLLESSDRLVDHQLLNASNMYVTFAKDIDTELFRQMVENDRLLNRRIGWQLASSKPSRSLAQAMDRILSQALLENRLEKVLIPQMANAVRSNKLKSAYTIIRQGLLAQGDEEYVLAMISLKPAQSSDDFLQYLLLASPEELRQLSLSSVNVSSVITILRHMKNFPPQMSTPGFDHLFAYMISRNNGISEVARAVLEQYLPHHASTLAIGLAKTPQWMQVAVLENVRREKSPGMLVLLNELKNTTVDQFIAKDIEAIQD
jgi:hypothetical protein